MSGGSEAEVEVYHRDGMDAVTAAWAASHPELFGVGTYVVSSKRQQLFRDTQRADVVGDRCDILDARFRDGMSEAERTLGAHPDLAPESFVRLRACHLAFALLCEELRACTRAVDYWMWRQSHVYGQGITAIADARGLGPRQARRSVRAVTTRAAQLVAKDATLKALWAIAGSRTGDVDDEAAAEKALETPSLAAQRLALGGQPLAAARTAAEDFVAAMESFR